MPVPFVAALRRVAKRLNHARLARRTAARARAMGLVGTRRLVLVDPSMALAGSFVGVSACLDAFGVGFTQTEQRPPAAAHVVNVFGPSACRGALPAGVFGLWLGGEDPLSVPDDWLAAARFVWVPGVDDVRALNSRGVPSPKVYVVPVGDCSPVPGGSLFVDRRDELMFFMGRFLLANQVIVFDAFYAHCAPGIHPLPATVCLGVIEYPERLDSFTGEGWHDIAYFPGLRHNIGWIGCGLSYKFLMALAQRQGRAFLAVCEDDVALPADWRVRIEPVVQQALTGPLADIDLFSGLITELPEDTSLLSTWATDGHTWATLDRTVGMVFNVYRAKLFPYLAAWREDWTDLKHNAIDRHLVRKPGLRVATTVPFLAGHKEGLTSTLWGKGNEIYVNRFEATRHKLQALLAQAPD